MIRESHIFRRWFILTLIVLAGLGVSTDALAGRLEIDLSAQDWGLYRDFEAGWINDDLYLPPVDIGSLPVNPPSCGWDALPARIEKTISIPSTVEEHFWGENGNIEAVAGDWRGVSWWTTTVTIPESCKDQRLFLDFESVHLRAEVFVNCQLVGYDIIGHTPFSVDITSATVSGTANEIAVRITDPLGNFNWNDRAVMRWGSHAVPASHGFGGITGRVTLRAVDPVHFENIFVQNTPQITEANIAVTMKNTGAGLIDGRISLKIHPRGEPRNVVWEDVRDVRTQDDSITVTFNVSLPDAQIWDLDNPDLYVARAGFIQAGSPSSAYADILSQRFGFRWFDVGEEDGDKRLYLNGRRFLPLGGMSWCFWPENGITPTREMAMKDVEVAKALGLNYMNFHRAIGQPIAMEVYDELGFFCYEEPGGYSCEGALASDDMYREWRRIKLLRMVRRDRNHPSLIMYNLQNRTPNPLSQEDVDNMLAAHEIDPTRIMTFISGFWTLPPEHAPEKLHLLPYDFTGNDHGWFDMHNHTPTSGYADDYYNSPSDYLRHTNNADEVIFWGEDGGNYSPPRLQLIRDYYDRKTGAPGWQGQRFLDWYKSTDAFLDWSGFRDFFPDVDALTVSLGNTNFEYHGRIIENVRAGNVGDAYTINGWAAPHITNQAQVADLYRNPVGDPAILSRYCKPLYLAVKIRDRVLPAEHSGTYADIYIINEAGISGTHELSLALEHDSVSKPVDTPQTVEITGGERYGQLLLENVRVPLDGTEGYFTLHADLKDKNGNSAASGSDTIFSVSIDGSGLGTSGAVVDTSSALAGRIRDIWGIDLPAFGSDIIDPTYIIVGRNDFTRARQAAYLLECVANGATAIVLDGADRFAEFLASDTSQAIDYYGRYPMGKGNFIAGCHPLLDGLPQAQAFGWEYQTLYRAPMHALRLKAPGTVVAAMADNKKDVGVAVCVIPYGRGHVILSTLNILPHLASDQPQSVVPKRLLENFMTFTSISRE